RLLAGSAIGRVHEISWPLARGWLTQGPEGNKDRGRATSAVARAAPVRQFAIRHAAPLLGRQVDDAVGARPVALASEGRADRPPQRCNEQQQAQDVSDKPR